MPNMYVYASVKPVSDQKTPSHPLLCVCPSKSMQSENSLSKTRHRGHILPHPGGENAVRSVYAHPRGPASFFLVDVDLVGERVRALRRYRGYVVLVRVDKRYDLHDSRHKRLFHGLADLCPLWSP